MEHARLLVADDDGDVRQTFATVLSGAGHEVVTAGDGGEVLARVREAPFDMLLQDLVFPPSDGIELLRQVKQLRPSTLVVLVSGHATVEEVIRGFRAGAFDFVPKPVGMAKLVELGARAVEIKRLGEERRRLAEELEHERVRVLELRGRLEGRDPFERLIGHSLGAQNLVDALREIARTDSTVLITGESGTGKSLVARTIHEASPRRAGPFVEANCVVYSEGVLHSELFGHEKGAFTGAARTKKGRFELAQGGSLFLDEVGEISRATQLMLLRVLQDRTFERVGGERTLEADVRLIAATNRDLQEAIRQGSFRRDLYYRLNVIPLHLPALREHPDDIPLLARHFVDRCNERLDRGVRGFTPAATDALARYHWPGNVRELENLVERLVVLSRSDTIDLAELPPPMRGAAAGPAAGASAAGSLRSIERGRILEALRESGGNKKRAAAILGIHRSTLYAKLRRHGLEPAAGDPHDDGHAGESDAAEAAAPVLAR